MSFLAFILIFVVTTTIQLIRTYDKGVTIKSINSSGRSITDLLSRDIGASKLLIRVPAANRLCLDNVSYVWNPPPGPGGTNKYTTATPSIQLVRVPDSGQSLCVSPYPNVPTNTGAEELLSTNIAVASLTTASTADRDLVRIDVRLSTSGSNAPTLAGGICDGGVVGEFCAASTFTTTIYVLR